MKNLAIAIACLFAPLVVHAQQKVPGTRVTMTPPAGFSMATHFAGFLSQGKGASIMVAEIPGSYEQLSAAFKSEEGLASQQMKAISTSEATISGRKGILLNASQSNRGTEYRKWVAAIGDSSETLLVVATFPQMYEKELSESMKSALLSIDWDQKGTTAPEVKAKKAALRFSVSEVPGMKRAHVMGNNILFNPHGSVPAKSLDDPMVVVASSASEKLTVPDRQNFARRHLRNTINLKDIAITSEKDINVDSIPGRMILAEALDKDTSHKRFVLHVLLYDNHGYYVFQGTSAFEEKEKYLPLFEKMLSSFSRK